MASNRPFYIILISLILILVFFASSPSEGIIKDQIDRTEIVLTKRVFSSPITKGDEVSIDDDSDGFLAWGAYVTLNEGTYHVKCYGENDGTESLLLIYSDGEVIYQDIYRPGKSFNIELSDGPHLIAPTIFYTGGGKVSFKKIRFNEYDSRLPEKVGRLAIVILAEVVLLLALLWGTGIIGRSKNTFINVLCSFLCGAVLTFLEFVFFEAAWRDVSVFRYAASVFDGEDALHILFLNMLILGVFNIFLYSLTRRAFFTILLSGALVIFTGQLEFNYYALRGESFYVGLLNLTGEATDVDYEYALTETGVYSIIIAIMLAILFLGKMMTEKRNTEEPARKKWLKRLIPIFVSTASMVALYFVIPVLAEDQIFTHREFNEKNGFSVGFVRTLPRKMKAPENYRKEYFDDLLSGYKGEAYEGDLPDIIFIQDESLSDMDLVINYSASENPLDELYNLNENVSTSYFLSPMAGGGTCNVEYEVLTAMPYANVGGTPFVDGLPADTCSLVSILNDLGYQTTAIHTNTEAFFNRHVTYNRLQFDEAYFSQNITLDETGYKIGEWLNDAYAYEVLKDVYENRDESKPFFGYVVTTQNHGIYPEAYDRWEIKVDGNMEEPGTRRLQTFLNLEKESVNSYKKLLEYFDNVDKDVVVVMYGDHCPSYWVFYFPDVSVKDAAELQQHFTPLLIWDNYGKEFDLKKDDVTAAYNLTPYILDQLGIYTDSYINYSRANHTPNVFGSTQINSFDDYSDITTWSEKMNDYWNSIWMIQYDRVYGNHYSLKQ